MRVEVVFEREEVGNLDEVDDEDDGALITNLGVGGEEGRKLLEGDSIRDSRRIIRNMFGVVLIIKTGVKDASETPSFHEASLVNFSPTIAGARNQKELTLPPTLFFCRANPTLLVLKRFSQ